MSLEPGPSRHLVNTTKESLSGVSPDQNDKVLVVDECQSSTPQDWFGAHTYSAPHRCGFKRNTVKAVLPNLTSYELSQHMRHPSHGSNISEAGLPMTSKPTDPNLPAPLNFKCTYASASPYALEQNPCYARGLCYVTDFDVSTTAMASLKAKLSIVVPQPEFRQGSFDGAGLYQLSVHGLVKAVFGVPYVYRHVNSPDFEGRSTDLNRTLSNLETRVKVDTLQTLKEYQGGDQVEEWLRQIQILTFGGEGVKPFFELLSKNCRSNSDGRKDSSNGSASIGFTVEEISKGIVGKAMQPAKEDLAFRRNQLLNNISKVALFTAERALLPHEIGLWRLLSRVNNAATFGDGGLWSSVQINFSTGTGNLAESIGDVQGNIHTDPKDWVGAPTVFICWVRYPKGLALHAGSFMFAQSGIYLSDDQRSTQFPSVDPSYEIRLYIAVFKGNEPHCGFPPVIPKEQSSLSSAKHIQRVGYVCYLPKRVIERATSLLPVFPSGNLFGTTEDALVSHSLSTYKCLSTDFLSLAPSHESHINFHMREIAYMVNNFANGLGIQLDPNRLSSLLVGSKVLDQDGRWSALPNSSSTIQDLHIPHSAEEMQITHSAIQWYITHCELSNLHIQRAKIKADRDQVRCQLADSTDICHAIQLAQKVLHAEEQTEPTIEIEALTDVRWNKTNGKVDYFVTLKGSQDTTVLSDGHQHFLVGSSNHQLLLDFLAQRLPPSSLSVTIPPEEGAIGKKRAIGEADSDANSESQGHGPSKLPRLDGTECHGSKRASPEMDVPFNSTFIDKLLDASLGLLNTEQPSVLDAAVTALSDSLAVGGELHKSFHPLRGILPRGAVTSSSINSWFEREVLLNTTENTVDFELYLQLGKAIHAYAYNDKKEFVVSRVSQWLAFKAMASFSSLMAPKGKIDKVTSYLFDHISDHRKHGQACTCEGLKFIIPLANHVIKYLESGVVDQTQQVPDDLLKPLCLTTGSRLHPIWTDIRKNPNSPRQLYRKNFDKNDFTLILRLVLEQIYVYENSKSFLQWNRVQFQVDSDMDHSVLHQIREHTLAVSGVLSVLEESFGSHVIFSFLCDGDWQKLVQHPMAFLLKNTKSQRSRANKTLANSFTETHQSERLEPVTDYIKLRLAERVFRQDGGLGTEVTNRADLVKARLLVWKDRLLKVLTMLERKPSKYGTT